MATRVTQANKEIAASGQTTNLHVTQNPLEVLVLVDGGTPPVPSLRVTQAPVEALVQIGSSEPINKLRVTQAPVEALVQVGSSQPLRVTQAPIEVLVSVATQVISMEDSDSISEGDVPDPTVSLMATPPPPPPPPSSVSYYYPSGGGKGTKWRPVKTGADVMLRKKEQAWKSYVAAWSTDQEGLRGLGRISNGLRWLVMGRQRRPFFKQGSIVTPSPADLDVPVAEFVVPEGYYGWISGFWWAYTGTGYEDGSTDLRWRIRIGDAYPDGYGDVRYQMGTATDPILITGMIPLRSRSRVQLIVFVANDSGAIQVGASRIIGGLTGWFYEPERTVGEKGIRW